MPEAWREVLAPLGTDAVKSHITDAPWVVILFRQTKRLRSNDDWGPTYYSTESCGIAAGMFISAIHRVGLTTLTHTPSPMGFLSEILDRPKHEVAMLVMPVGYPFLTSASQVAPCNLQMSLHICTMSWCAVARHSSS